MYFSQISDKKQDIIYVSPACITREVYINTLKEILKNQANHIGCEKEEKLCPTCALFGTISDKLKVASKIRFSDAKVVKEKNSKQDYYDAILTLPELSSPKLSTTEFYLQKPEDTTEKILNWTYDYYVVLGANGIPIEKRYMPKISGRKFYWHSLSTPKAIRSGELQAKEKNNRNKTVRPVISDISFRGELYFEEITKGQLDELIAILNMSNFKISEKKSEYAMKLGAAKPFGFGSVKLFVDDVKIRTIGFDKTGRLSYNEQLYDEIFINEERKVVSDSNLKTIFKDSTSVLPFLDIHTLPKGKLIYYPSKEYQNQTEEQEGFRWFTENRIAYKIDRDGKLETRVDAGPRKRTQVMYQNYLQAGMFQFVRNEEMKNNQSNNSNKTKENFSMNGNIVHKCKKCNRKVAINPRTNKYYEYCWECNPYSKKK